MENINTLPPRDIEGYLFSPDDWNEKATRMERRLEKQLQSDKSAYYACFFSTPTLESI
jgi:hypothetical protein